MEGSAISFDSRVPSNHELETLPQLITTSKEPLDPKSNPLCITQVWLSAALLKPKIQHEADHILRWLATSWMNTNSANAQSAAYALPNNGPEPRPECRITSCNEPGPEFYLCEAGPGPAPTCEPGTAPASYAHEHGPGPAPTYEPGPAPGPTTRPHVSALHPTKRHSDATPENLIQIWNIGLETAQRTLRITTQFGTRSAIHPITRCSRVDHLHYNRHHLNTTFYMDGLQSRIVSLRGNKHAQVYTNGQFTTVYPSSSKSKAGDSLRELSDDVGIPENLIANLAGEQSGQFTEFLDQCRRLHIHLHYTEKGRKNQNHKAEREIGVLKQRWKDRMASQNVPSRLWDYGLVYEAETLSQMSRAGSDRTGYEILTGEMPNIMEWLDFSFYDLIWYHVSSYDTTTQPHRLGRWLGISHHVGSALCYLVLTQSAQVMSSTNMLPTMITATQN